MSITRREALKLGGAAIIGGVATEVFRVAEKKGLNIDQVEFYSEQAIERFRWLTLNGDEELSPLGELHGGRAAFWDNHKAIIGVRGEQVRFVIPYKPHLKSFTVLSLRPSDNVVNYYGEEPHLKLIYASAELPNSFKGRSLEGARFFLQNLHESSELKDLPHIDYQRFFGLKFWSKGINKKYNPELLSGLRFTVDVPYKWVERSFQGITEVEDGKITDENNKSLLGWSEHDRSFTLVGGREIDPHIGVVYTPEKANPEIKYYLV